MISKGLCWRHGGGKRCLFNGCKRPASLSKQNFCSRHEPTTTILDNNTTDIPNY
ncbi:hypothetical protein PHMEG_000531 [Phytophthora megakarya]|uniref:Uncharacterized protein n=1 Tax=Phytophthora megakarya TaxID=4795 RepID=A0A225X2R7_9STRA|nr:hypothetical protein PHMEG_000531 [Phytophthora megakarya]